MIRLLPNCKSKITDDDDEATVSIEREHQEEKDQFIDVEVMNNITGGSSSWQQKDNNNNNQATTIMEKQHQTSTKLLSRHDERDDAMSSSLFWNKSSFLQQQFDNSSILQLLQIGVIVAVYFIQGALGLASLAESFVWKDQYHLGPAQLASLTGILTLPWTIKPLYGFQSDAIPLYKNNRRESYLVLCGLMSFLCFYLLGQQEPSLTNNNAAVLNHDNGVFWTAACLFVSSTCIAFADVVADGMVVEQIAKMRNDKKDDEKIMTNHHRPPEMLNNDDDTVTIFSRENANEKMEDNHDFSSKNSIIDERDEDVDESDLQSLCWASRSVGGLLSAYFSGSLLQTMTPQQVFRLTSGLPLLMTFVALFSILQQEQEQEESSIGPSMQQTQSDDISIPVQLPSTSTTAKAKQQQQPASTAVVFQTQIQELWSVLQREEIWKPCLFFFLWQSTPTSEGAFFYFVTNDLGMGPEFLGRLSVVSEVASLGGIALYQQYLKENVSIPNILTGSTILSAFLGLCLNYIVITHSNRAWGIPDGALLLGDDIVLTVLGQVAFLPTLVLAARICPPGVEAVLFATLMSLFNGASALGTEVGALLTKQLGITENNFDNLIWLSLICNLSSLYPLFFMKQLLPNNDNDNNQQEKVVDKG